MHPTFPRSRPIPYSSREINHLVDAIDNRCSSGAGAPWTARVLGVHTNGTDYWIQVGADHVASTALVLHLRPGATVGGAVAALSLWDPLHSDPQTVITTDAHGPVRR